MDLQQVLKPTLPSYKIDLVSLLSSHPWLFTGSCPKLHEVLRYTYFLFDPLSSNIHLQILHTDLHTFSWKTSGENLSKDQSVFT